MEPQISADERRWRHRWPDILLAVVGLSLGGCAAFGGYWAGRCGISLDMGFTMLLFLAMLGALAAGLGLCARVVVARAKSLPARLARVLMAGLIVLLSFSCLIGRPGATAYLDGFNDVVWSRTDASRVQQWGETVLARHARGELKLRRQPWDTLHGAPQLADEEIPEFIRQLWAEPPSYVAIEKFSEGEGECVLISWYLHGIIVGPGGIKPGIRAFCIRQVYPGVYVFIREK